jgi:hypothetical protein
MRGVKLDDQGENDQRVQLTLISKGARVGRGVLILMKGERAFIVIARCVDKAQLRSA